MMSEGPGVLCSDAGRQVDRIEVGKPAVSFECFPGEAQPLPTRR